MKKILIGALLFGSLSLYGVENLFIKTLEKLNTKGKNSLTYLETLDKSIAKPFFKKCKKYVKPKFISYPYTPVKIEYRRVYVIKNLEGEGTFHYEFKIEKFYEVVQEYKRKNALTKKEKKLLKETQNIFRSLEQKFPVLETKKKHEDQCNRSIENFLNLPQKSTPQSGLFRSLYLNIMSWLE